MNFLGTTTPSTLLASLTSGVQSTGADFWPLAALIGVPLAFIVGGMVIDFIRGAVAPRLGDPDGPAGYYEGNPPVYAEDQEAARIRYNIEEHGMTDL